MTDTETPEKDVEVKHRYILYRTKAMNWQPAGWVILACYYKPSELPPPPDVDEAWAQDDAGKYHYATDPNKPTLYPVPDPSDLEPTVDPTPTPTAA